MLLKFYNNLDKQLEADIEVLDDFTQEAKEVSTKNDWLNYALPIHRCREMGYHSRLLDLLDEKPLSPERAARIFIPAFWRRVLRWRS
jgi:hypothetical protein